MTTTSSLHVAGLQKQFKNRQVVKNVSLDINSGEVVGLLGPNGAGKTTSFYMIVGIIAADDGSIVLDGQEMRHLPIHVRAQRGFVPAGGGQLELTGQVIAISPPQAPPATRIETESLTLLLGEHHAQTSDAVTITQPGLTMRGIGMRADLDRQHVSLLSQVRARYVPQH